MNKDAYFNAKLFTFLRELCENNHREWFHANKDRYKSEVRYPLLRFIEDFGKRLHKISPHFIADPRPVGGSLFRIYRDARFSQGKPPYKTNAGVHFRHAQAKDVHAPGFYLHLEPDCVFAGSGIWHPERETLAKIREAIVANPAKWKRATNGKIFKRTCTLAGDSLKRAPKDYDPNHPLIEDLKRKDFLAHTDFTEEEVCAPDFMDRFTNACKASAPLVKFLARALALPY